MIEYDSDDLIKELHRCFKAPRPTTAVSLRETELRDNYEPEHLCLAERAKTPYQFWQDVPQALLVETTGIGGPAFFNDDSWRFYTPAYLRLWIQYKKSFPSRPEALDSFAYALSYKREGALPRSALFTPDQKVITARILLIDVQQDEFSVASAALFRDFVEFLPAGSYTKKLHKRKHEFFKQ